MPNSMHIKSALAHLQYKHERVPLVAEDDLKLLVEAASKIISDSSVRFKFGVTSDVNDRRKSYQGVGFEELQQLTSEALPFEKALDVEEALCFLSQNSEWWPQDWHNPVNSETDKPRKYRRNSTKEPQHVYIAFWRE